jgi:putative ABC transport system permease protein
MNPAETIRIAMTALRANKLRSLLTMLGIIIGVGAVVTLLAFGNGFSRFLNAELNSFGVGVFYVLPTIDSDRVDPSGEPWLTAADASAILASGRAPSVRAISYELGGKVVASAGDLRYRFDLKGVSASYFDIRSPKLGAGRLFSAEEARQSARLAIVGSNVAEQLFGSIEAASGKRLTLNGVTFEVIGVTIDKAGTLTSDGTDPTRRIFVPYEAAVTRLFRNQTTARVDLNQITVQAFSREQVTSAVSEVSGLLRERHHLSYQNNDFSILNLEQIAAQAGTITNGFNLFLGSIAGISLFVGGIGIMNIMLVSVTERTREIGLRKAVGARREDILFQFLVESVVLSMIGCAIGIGIGYLLAPVGTLLLQGLGNRAAIASVPLSAVVLATLVSIAVGVFFGLVPAVRASRLHPIQALRSE